MNKKDIYYDFHIQLALEIAHKLPSNTKILVALWERGNSHLRNKIYNTLKKSKLNDKESQATFEVIKFRMGVYVDKNKVIQLLKHLVEEIKK